MKRRQWLLFLLALVLTLSAGIAPAFAYFTCYTSSQGSVAVRLQNDTEIRETVDGWSKHVTVGNSEGSYPVFIRVRAFSGEAYDLTYSGPAWTRGADGYWYYEEPLEGGDTTAELLVQIQGVPEDAQPEEGASVSVVVVYESTPALYSAAGAPDQEASWSTGNVTVISEGGDV